jgi:hypothetical protein
MNRWDVEEACGRYATHPVLGPATVTLANLMAWTDSHSDGWAYWPKPTRAAAKLMALIEGDNHPEGVRGARFDYDRDDATPALLQAAIRPIKAFRTREGADFEIVA